MLDEIIHEDDIIIHGLTIFQINPRTSFTLSLVHCFGVQTPYSSLLIYSENSSCILSEIIKQLRVNKREKTHSE